MAQSDPDQLRLVQESGAALFEAVAARGGVPVEDPLVADEPEATQLLVRLGVLREEDGRYIVVDPQMAQGAVVTPLSQRAAEAIDAASSWAQAFSQLTQAYRRYPPTADGPMAELHGEQLNAFLEQVVEGARDEVLTAQPQVGRSAAGLRTATARDLAALQRGVRLRTIYQHAARRARFTRQYVDLVTAEGGEVRTLDEFFNRLIVVDRRVALIPSAHDRTTAVVIRDSNLVAYLVDIFERNWDRGLPFTQTTAEIASTIAAEQRAMATRMLIEGHPDSASAKRMGVSDRTYAAYLADLKRDYDAQTRFQLGYRMGLEASSGSRDD
ncbi:LuxR family transcriptional regulator [Nocardioides jiangxiensis]|uniref:LuxR family transcriptional regulator n=1 Tax=Nocardioides jiangxiensis TaxID=3064524 RepID=A0ABT9B421_9ACTN|nr:LuxR family transcriptional regulator [Nocardioides sp. WY-20]MDO7868337.1 LuxR family transcriptional regulator [Nocardioides sp. WY-20]